MSYKMDNFPISLDNMIKVSFDQTLLSQSFSYLIETQKKQEEEIRNLHKLITELSEEKTQKKEDENFKIMLEAYLKDSQPFINMVAINEQLQKYSLSTDTKLADFIKITDLQLKESNKSNEYIQKRIEDVERSLSDLLIIQWNPKELASPEANLLVPLQPADSESDRDEKDKSINYRLNIKVGDFQARLQEVEKKIELFSSDLALKDKYENEIRQRLSEINPNNPIEKSDLLLEVNGKYLTMLSELNKLRDMIRALCDLPNEEVIQIPSLYVPYISRIGNIEKKLENMDHWIFDIETVKKQINEIANHKYGLKKYNSHIDILDNNEGDSKLTKENEEISDVKYSKKNEKAKDEFKTNIEKEIENKILAIYEEDLKQLNAKINQIAFELSQKASLSDIAQQFISLSKFKADQANNIFDPEKIKKIEDRLQQNWLEALVIDPEASGSNKFLSPVLKQKPEQDTDFAELLKLHEEYTLSEIENVTKELKKIEQRLTKYWDFSRISEMRIQDLIKSVQGCEELIALNGENISKIQESFKKKSKLLSEEESKSLAHLQELETLREKIQEIIQRIQEGSKLHKRDYDTLQELKKTLNSKTSKEDIEQKVDKNELKKLARLLTKKVLLT